MKMNPQVKLSVIVLAYNQEKIISKTLDSILAQKDYLYELLIGDDCSKDGTRGVLKEYEKRYPGIVKPIFNEVNLGIYGNKENLIKHVSGNLMLSIAGDDLYCDGYFKQLVEFVERNGLDCENEAFVIHCNHKRLYSDNRPNRVVKCNRINKVKSLPTLFLRGGVPTYGRAWSKKVFEQIKPVPCDIGICVDLLADFQPVLIAKKNYVLDYVGFVYNAGIGVSVTEKEQKRLISSKKALQKLKEEYDWDEKDLLYIDHVISKKEYSLNPNIKNFFSASITFFGSFKLNPVYIKLGLYNYLKFSVRAFLRCFK